MKTIVQVFAKSFKFTGRAGRKEYWIFLLFTVASWWVCYAADVKIVLYDSRYPFGVLIAVSKVLLFFPELALSVRRLHDINKSGWWYLISLIPYFGVLAFNALDSQLMSAASPDTRYSDRWSLIISYLPLISSLVLYVFMAIAGTRGDNRFGKDPLSRA